MYNFSKSSYLCPSPHFSTQGLLTYMITLTMREVNVHFTANVSLVSHAVHCRIGRMCFSFCHRHVRRLTFSPFYTGTQTQMSMSDMLLCQDQADRFFLQTHLSLQVTFASLSQRDIEVSYCGKPLSGR